MNEDDSIYKLKNKVEKIEKKLRVYEQRFIEKDHEIENLRNRLEKMEELAFLKRNLKSEYTSTKDGEKNREYKTIPQELLPYGPISEGMNPIEIAEKYKRNRLEIEKQLVDLFGKEKFKNLLQEAILDRF